MATPGQKLDLFSVIEGSAKAHSSYEKIHLDELVKCQVTGDFIKMHFHLECSLMHRKKREDLEKAAEEMRAVAAHPSSASAANVPPSAFSGAGVTVGVGTGGAVGPVVVSYGSRDVHKEIYHNN